MKHTFICLIALGAGALFAAREASASIYNNLTPNNLMAVATRPESGGQFEIEAADDFNLGSRTFVQSASFTGLIVPGSTPGFSVSNLTVEMYRVFSLDSDTNRLPNVPTRANSPSDNAFASKDNASGGLSFSSTVLSSSFTALNSVQPGGIHPKPTQNTLGNGPITGEEVQFDVTFSSPFDLPADHFFFVPQVGLTNGAQFYWLSASRPINGAGTTPLVRDLQSWTRDANLDPDWLRVGTDIVGGNPAPTFNGAFSLSGSPVPEPALIFPCLAGLASLIGVKRYKQRAR